MNLPLQSVCFLVATSLMFVGSVWVSIKHISAQKCARDTLEIMGARFSPSLEAERRTLARLAHSTQLIDSTSTSSLPNKTPPAFHPLTSLKGKTLNSHLAQLGGEVSIEQCSIWSELILRWTPPLSPVSPLSHRSSRAHPPLPSAPLWFTLAHISSDKKSNIKTQWTERVWVTDRPPPHGQPSVHHTHWSSLTDSFFGRSYKKLQ